MRVCLNSTTQYLTTSTKNSGSNSKTNKKLREMLILLQSYKQLNRHRVEALKIRRELRRSLSKRKKLLSRVERRIKMPIQLKCLELVNGP